MKTLLNSDKYQYTMAYTFDQNGMGEKMAVFNMFFRKAPDGNGFAVVSGIKEVLEMVKEMGKYPKDYYRKFLQEDKYEEFCEKLASTKFTGTIRAMKEGEIAYPNEPVITVIAPLIQGQILETPMLGIMNHQMAVATKASRVVRSTLKPVSEFGSRRAHGIWAGKYGAKAAYIAGCTNSSNTLATIDLGVPCTGTMAHSYIGTFGSSVTGEFEAFDKYIKSHKGESLIMLIDTYDTLKCGIKNAIKAFQENGIDDTYQGIYGVRLDSGDLAYISKKCRKMLDEAGLKKAIISATNGLDEYIIPELEKQDAEIDMYGVGDAIATSKHNPCFGGVYKLTQIGNEPVIKLSEDKIKVTNPGNLVTLRMMDLSTKKYVMDVTCQVGDNTMNSLIAGDEVTLTAEDDKTKTTTFAKNSYQVHVLQENVVINGEFIEIDSIEMARQYHTNVKSKFDDSHLRLINPHIYKVNISDELYNLKLQMIYKIKEEVKNFK